MSDPNTTPENETVEDVPSVDDAVARANEGLADAEAASLAAVTETAEEQPIAAADPEPVAPEQAAPEATSDDAPAGDAAPETAADTPAPVVADAEPVADAADAEDAEPVAWYDQPLEDTPGAADPVIAEAAVVEAAAAEPETVDAPETVASTAVYAPPADTFVAAASQPIFVQAPEAPRPRGNRGVAGAIGLLAAVAFAILTFGIQFGAAFVLGDVTASNASAFAAALASSWVFWVPVVFFFFGFWFLGAILNRARWGHWAIWGLLVGAVAYGGYIFGVLFEAPFWTLTASAGRALVADTWFAPFAIVSFVVGREVTIWFGAWVAARGRRVTELNEVARAEYERTLEAGPQLYQQ